MKDMNTLDFVTLATSKDDTRYNMTQVYRDKTELVGTDGHRLHYVDNLPPVEKPHFLSGLDAPFPEWRQVIPPATEQKFTIVLTREKLKAFKLIAGLAKIANNHDCPAKCTLIRDSILHIELNQSGITASMDFAVSEGPDTVPWAFFNLGYLLDVFDSALKYASTNKLAAAIVDIYPHSLERDPWLFEIPGLGKAIVMKLNPNKY
jgi:DNA polymerase III sliding clamp (beta) subunit (PCNA family)